MQPLSDGINIDPAIHVQVLTNKLVQATMREAQMEAGIQTLIARNRELEAQVMNSVEEVLDASAK